MPRTLEHMRLLGAVLITCSLILQYLAMTSQNAQSEPSVRCERSFRLVVETNNCCSILDPDPRPLHGLATLGALRLAGQARSPDSGRSAVSNGWMATSKRRCRGFSQPDICVYPPLYHSQRPLHQNDDQKPKPIHSEMEQAMAGIHVQLD